MAIEESVFVLHNFQGTSDKLYVIRIDDYRNLVQGYGVVASYGKATAQALTDTPKGLFDTWAEAHEAATKLFREKQGGGYSEVTLGQPGAFKCPTDKMVTFLQAINKIDTGALAKVQVNKPKVALTGVKWQTKENGIIDIAQMSDAHLCNALNMVYRSRVKICHAANQLFSWGSGETTMKAMVKLAEKRGLKWQGQTDELYTGPPPPSDMEEYTTKGIAGPYVSKLKIKSNITKKPKATHAQAVAPPPERRGRKLVV